MLVLNIGRKVETGRTKKSSDDENASSQISGGLRSQARLRKRGLSRGPAVSNTQTAVVLGALMVSDVLQHNGEDKCFPTRDEVTPFYVGSQEENIVDTAPGSLDFIGDRAPRIVKP